MKRNYLYRIACLVLIIVCRLLVPGISAKSTLHAQNNSTRYYLPQIENYEYKGISLLVQLIQDEHALRLMPTGWNDERQGCGFYFYTYRDPQIFINYMMKRCGKPTITTKEYTSSNVMVEDWKCYHWKNVRSFIDPTVKIELYMDARSYYDLSTMYMPCYEFFIRPAGKGIVDPNEPPSKRWMARLSMYIDSLYIHQPAFKNPVGTLFTRQVPINRDTLLTYWDNTRFPGFTQEVIETGVDSLGRVEDIFLNYHVKERGTTGVFDSLFLSRLRFPLVDFLDKIIPYRTLLFVEHNPYKTRWNLFAQIVKGMNAEHDSIETKNYSLYYRQNNGREFYFSQLGFDSLFVFEKTNPGWNTLLSIGYDFDSWNDYYTTSFSLEDFNRDGWTDLLVRYGEPFDGSGSQFVSMYVFDPVKNTYVPVPSLSEHDLNEIVPYNDQGKNYLAVYTHGSNFDTHVKYKYEWTGLELVLVEYATKQVYEPDSDHWHERIDHYQLLNGKWVKVSSVKIQDQEKASQLFKGLVFSSSLLRYY